jgi:predicted negative regulator of RcsB-dependent stress response
MAKKEIDGPPVQEHVYIPKPDTAIELLLQQHGKKLFALLLIGVVVGCGWFIMNSLNKEKMAESGAAFTAANTINELNSVVDKYAGSAAAGNALLMMADRHQSNGDNEDARAALLKFTKDYAKHPLIDQGLLSLGILSAKSGNADEANKYFAQIVDKGTTSELAPLAMMRQAEILLGKGELTAARDLYDNIPKKFIGTPFFPVIEERIKAIERRITLAENPPPAPEEDPEETKEEPKTETEPIVVPEITPATPADATPADAAPADATPADATPADATPADATPADATPADAAAPIDKAPEN